MFCIGKYSVDDLLFKKHRSEVGLFTYEQLNKYILVFVIYIVVINLYNHMDK